MKTTADTVSQPNTGHHDNGASRDGDSSIEAPLLLRSVAPNHSSECGEKTPTGPAFAGLVGSLLGTFYAMRLLGRTMGSR